MRYPIVLLILILTAFPSRITRVEAHGLSIVHVSTAWGMASRMDHAASDPPTGVPVPTPTPPPATPTPLPTPVGGGAGSGNGCPAGEFGIAFWPAPLCIDISSLLGQIIQGIGTLALQALGALTAPFVNMLIMTPDFTQCDPGNCPYGDLQNFFSWMRQIAAALLVLCTVLGALEALLRATGRSAPHLVAAPLTRLVVGTGLLLLLPQAMIWWFQGVNATSQSINSFTGNLGTDLVSKLLEMAFGAALGVNTLTLVYAVFGIVAVVLLCLIGIVRMVGFMLLAALYVVGPVTLALWVFPRTAHIARAWFNAFLAVSLWGPAYAVVLKVISIVIVALPETPQLIGFDIIQPLLGLAGLVILYRVPRIVGSLTGSVIAGESGVSAPADVLVGAAEGYVRTEMMNSLP